MKLIGIDQTTGQQRVVLAADSIVGNVGYEVEIAVTQVGDYSGNTRNRVTVWGLYYNRDISYFNHS